MKSETKLFLGIILGTIAIVAAGILLLSRSAAPVKVNESLLVHDDSHKIASGSATVTLVEFSDFQCPACGAYYPVVKQVVDDFKDSLVFVYRNFPLTTIHQNAQIAAQAAEAAGLQGKYWEMHDLLFTNQSEWSASSTPKDVFTGYAKTLGMNTEKFAGDIDSDAVKKRVSVDVADATALGIDATPTFFLDGVKLDNPASLADFETLLRAEIQKAPKPTVTKTEAYHTHFNLKVYVNGAAFDFTPDKYQSNNGKDLNEDIHLHDGKGDLVHIHKKGVTLGTFFTSMKMSLTKDSFTDEAGHTYKVSMYVNGKPNTQFDSYQPQDLDKILITEGPVVAVADDACIYSLKCPERGKPPTENCVGGLGTDCKD